MRTVLILTLVLALGACAGGRMSRLEDRVASLEEKVEGWSAPPTVWNPGGCIQWPGTWDPSLKIIPSVWPSKEPPTVK